MSVQTALTELSEVAARIKEMRGIMGWSEEEMAKKTEVSRKLQALRRGQGRSPLHLHSQMRACVRN